MQENRKYDIIVWGATGFTGQLVAENLLTHYGVDGSVRWAIAGRNEEKLNQVLAQLGDPAVDTLVADSNDRASLEYMASRTKVVLTTVGPYALYGEKLVEACINTDTDYCDLTGEVPFMRSMLDKYADAAKNSQARIVHCCGFDSIPSDLGVWFLQQAARQQFGHPLKRIKMRVKAAKGGLSGGTYASMLNIGEQAANDPAIAKILKNPFAICPEGQRKGVRQPYVAGPKYDADFNVWLAPFIMAIINTRIVNRTNALLDYQYDNEFVYDEAMMMGRGVKGRLQATLTAVGMGAFLVGVRFAPTKALLQKFVIPEAGEGPDKQERETGFFKLLFRGTTSDGQTLSAQVSGDRDPGYGSTCRMISETAILLSELDKGAKPGGFWTPAALFEQALIDRLEANAGLTFELK